MKRLESYLGVAALGFFALWGVFAIYVLGTLFVKGTPDRQPEYMIAQAEAKATAAQQQAAQPEADPAQAAPADAAPAQTAQADIPPAPVPVAAQVAALDPAAGQKVFAKCKACHDDSAAAKNKVGPALWGVVGANVGHVADFKYSDAMLGFGGQWTPERLDEYLADPKGAIPGNKMAFAGLKKAEDRHNVIAYLAGQSDTPIPAETLPFGAAAGAAPVLAETAAEGAAIAADAQAEAATQEAVGDEIVQIAYTNPPERTAEEQAAIDERVAALKAEIEGMDYERARMHPIHNAPLIETASDEECLVCHQEILDHEVRAQSPAGVEANQSLAWYQTLDTYFPKEGTGQSDFHWRHMESPLAQDLMNLDCVFCHKGNNIREESPDMLDTREFFTASLDNPEFTLRKQVNPSETCLRCHGAMPEPTEIMGLGGPWHEVRADMEDQAEDDPTLANGCLSCHQDLFRTNRHNVTYLNAANIEDLAQAGSDTCYGCHGGRAWYRISYPYPRTPWPGMDPEIPEWAVDRPTQSDPRYLRDANAQQ